MLKGRDYPRGRRGGCTGQRAYRFRWFNAVMVQQVLDDANIGARFEQVRGVGVAQHMQRNGPADVGASGGLLHHQL